MKHHSHPNIIKRLKRVEGHVRSIIKMLEEERECADIAQQLHAVEAAIGNAKRELIHDHIEHCLDDSHANSAAEMRAQMKELKTLSKYL
ncbi:MAG: nickel resistance protein [Methylocystaceae bacterium]|nr:nickel resistance protein [Methylocystaceae bacterium]